MTGKIEESEERKTAGARGCADSRSGRRWAERGGSYKIFASHPTRQHDNACGTFTVLACMAVCWLGSTRVKEGGRREGKEDKRERRKI